MANPVSLTIELYEAERIIAAERPKNINDQSDIEGNVTGIWLGLTDKGLGKVSYGNKVYKTIPLGASSIKRGTSVLMNYAKGVYYSNW